MFAVSRNFQQYIAFRENHTFLVFGKTATGVIYETLRIDEVNLSTCLFLCEAVQSEEAHQLRGNSNACRSSSEEQNAMGCEGQTRSGRRNVGSIQETTEDNGAGPLDIIIEDRVLVAESLKILERVVGGEILQIVFNYFL